MGIVIVYFLAHRVRRIAQYTVADILEKRYTPAAKSFRIERRLLNEAGSGGAETDAVGSMVESIMDSTADDFRASLAAGLLERETDSDQPLGWILSRDLEGTEGSRAGRKLSAGARVDYYEKLGHEGTVPDRHGEVKFTHRQATQVRGADAEWAV